MEIKGLTVDAFAAIVADVSIRKYNGNVVLPGRGRPAALNQAGTRFRTRVIVSDSRGPGARRTPSGRRQPAACWHVFRDVIRETLAAYPDTVLRTGLARYDTATFELTYRETGRRTGMSDLCECRQGAE
jgi:hypothetical protein